MASLSTTIATASAPSVSPTTAASKRLHLAAADAPAPRRNPPRPAHSPRPLPGPPQPPRPSPSPAATFLSGRTGSRSPTPWAWRCSDGPARVGLPGFLLLAVASPCMACLQRPAGKHPRRKLCAPDLVYAGRWSRMGRPRAWRPRSPSSCRTSSATALNRALLNIPNRV